MSSAIFKIILKSNSVLPHTAYLFLGAWDILTFLFLIFIAFWNRWKLVRSWNIEELVIGYEVSRWCKIKHCCKYLRKWGTYYKRKIKCFTFNKLQINIWCCEVPLMFMSDTWLHGISQKSELMSYSWFINFFLWGKTLEPLFI